MTSSPISIQQCFALSGLAYSCALAHTTPCTRYAPSMSQLSGPETAWRAEGSLCPQDSWTAASYAVPLVHPLACASSYKRTRASVMLVSALTHQWTETFSCAFFRSFGSLEVCTSHHRRGDTAFLTERHMLLID